MSGSGLTTDEGLAAPVGQNDESGDHEFVEAAVEDGPVGGEAGGYLSRLSAGLPDEVSGLVWWLARVVTNLGTVVFQACAFLATSVASYVRRHPVHTAANLALAGMIGLLAATGIKINQQLVEQKLSDATVDALVAASGHTRAYSLVELRERGDRELLRAGAPPWAQRESVQAILGAARKAGLSVEHQAVLLATAEIESGLNPMATAATTSACGVFQFIRETGAKFGLKDSECLDPWLSAAAEIDHYIINYQSRIESQVANLEGPEQLLRMFELSFYLHHDGPLSNSPSSELKAIVLAGTPFLFRAYNTLRRERRVQESEPTFLDKLRAERNAAVSTVVTLVRRTLGSGAGLGETEAAAASFEPATAPSFESASVSRTKRP